MLLLEFQQAENKFVIKTLPKDIKKKMIYRKIFEVEQKQTLLRLYSN